MLFVDAEAVPQFVELRGELFAGRVHVLGFGDEADFFAAGDLVLVENPFELGQIVAVKYIVAKHKCAAIVANKFCAYDKSLCQAIG